MAERLLGIFGHEGLQLGPGPLVRDIGFVGVAIESRELRARGFEVQPIVPKAVLVLSPNSVGAVPERKE